MDNALEKAFSAQTFTGYWQIQSKDYPDDYWGELSYDPRKGIHQLTLYGICIFPSIGASASQSPVITGVITSGKIVSVFGSVIVNAKTGPGEKLNQKTVFSFLSFCVGEQRFWSKDSILLRKYSFRCTNLEVWAGYHLIGHRYSSRAKRTMGTVSLPKILPLYENDVVRIKLGTESNQKSSSYSLEVFCHHFILIEVKGNRKLPYYGETNSISYYESIIKAFFCFVIGKHVQSFHHVGTTKKQRMKIPSDVAKNIPKRIQYDFEHVEFFSAYNSFDDNTTREIQAHELLVHHSQINGEKLIRSIKLFFECYQKIDFVLYDWIQMRNRTSYAYYSLPELIYSFEGLHRSLFPECDTKTGYKTTINEIHHISPFAHYDELIRNSKHELPLRQRLQDVLLIKTEPIFQFLTVQQRQTIINNLVEVRNDTAHRRNIYFLRIQNIIPYIFLCEELIAIMILQCIGFHIDEISSILQERWNWLGLKNMLLEEFEEDDDAHE